MPNNYDRLRPDFDAEMQLPEWLQMGEEQQSPDINPFASALKKRMGGSPQGGLGRSQANLLHGGGTETGLPLLRSSDMGAVRPKGGMQSL